MEKVELIFKYTQDEFVKAEKQYLFASKTITKTNVIIFFLYLPFSIIYICLSSFSIYSIILFGLAIFFLIALCILYFYIPVYKFKQTSKYQEEYHLTFFKDGIKFQTETINSELTWNVYSKIWESDDFYFLIQSPRMYALIPKRAFLNPASEQTFEHIALTNLRCTKRIL